MPIDEIDEELGSRVEELGMELVDVEWGGSRQRPLLRLRIDFPDAVPGHGVTVADCAKVSRALEGWLDEHPALPERYVLEVSSPGVERPLRRKRDFDRFVGHEVKIGVAGGRGKGAAGWVQGILERTDQEGEEGFLAVIRRANGEHVRIREDEILQANLVFRWQDEDRSQRG